MNKSKIGNQKTRNRLGTIAITLAIMFALVGSMQVAEAKYWYTFAGHPAIVYEWADLSSSVQPYIHYVEYDMAYTPGYGYGVRLHLLEAGRAAIAAGADSESNYPLALVTTYVMSRNEWYSDRTRNSVRAEIWAHASWPKTTVDIEYFYQDLKSWEYYKYIH